MKKAKDNLINEALSALEEARKKLVRDELFDNEAFEVLGKPLESAIFKEPDFVLSIIEAQTRPSTPSDFIYAGLSNRAGDLLESGEYHIYRGVLNPLGPGPALLRFFDECNDEMVRSGHISQEYAERQKLNLREGIKLVG